MVRVREIPAGEDHGKLTRFLGFPRPIRAELDFTGVGGRRQAVFSKGLVFEEVVKEYEDQKRMFFSIRADPHAIPSTTMDEHVVIGGDYFDVLDGAYRLEKLGEGLSPASVQSFHRKDLLQFLCELVGRSYHERHSKQYFTGDPNKM